MSEQPKQTWIAVVIGAIAADGFPELLPIWIKATNEQHDNGDVYAKAREIATEAGYDPTFAMDKQDFADRFSEARFLDLWRLIGGEAPISKSAMKGTV